MSRLKYLGFTDAWSLISFHKPDKNALRQIQTKWGAQRSKGKAQLALPYVGPIP